MSKYSELKSKWEKYIYIWYIPTIMITISSWFFYLLPSTSYPARLEGWNISQFQFLIPCQGLLFSWRHFCCWLISTTVLSTRPRTVTVNISDGWLIVQLPSVIRDDCSGGLESRLYQRRLRDHPDVRHHTEQGPNDNTGSSQQWRRTGGGEQRPPAETGLVCPGGKDSALSEGERWSAKSSDWNLTLL